MDIPRAIECQWVAVRCCCTPKRVLGFMRLDQGIVRAGHRFRQRGNGRPASRESTWPDTYRREFAIYSEDRPIEFWRQVMGFIEAPA